MTIAVGDSIPTCTLSVMGSEGPAPVSTADLFNNNKILMFAVPGAFTPGCSMTHLPGYVVNADKIKEMGIDVKLSKIIVKNKEEKTRLAKESIAFIQEIAS